MLEDDSDPDVQAEAESIKQAREDPRAIKIRESIFAAIRAVVELWSAHSDISHVRPRLLFYIRNAEQNMLKTTFTKGLSELCKSITSLPVDATVISLPAGPLLELVCLAAQRQLTAAWLSLAHILIAQLNPPIYSLNLKNGPSTEAEMVIQRLLPILLETTLTRLGAEGAMESVRFSLLLLTLGVVG